MKAYTIGWSGTYIQQLLILLALKKLATVTLLDA
jgi:hypothetical protein